VLLVFANLQAASKSSISHITKMNHSRLPLSQVKVGLVGTGFVAKLRAEALQSDARATLCAVVGHSPEKTQAFAQPHQAEVLSSWVDLVHRPDLDLIIISTINRDHGAIAQAALTAGKHVVVEYPLALDVGEAEKIVALARSRNLMLHIEHLELLGGVHQAFKAALPQIGSVGYARYATITPQRPVRDRWTYQPDLFGFPLMGALSRLHRLIDVFGKVKQVSCQAQTWHHRDQTAYHSSICTTQLVFETGVLAEVVYGKGEHFWHPERSLVVEGEKGALVFEGDEGVLINADGRQNLDVGARRGLFIKDTLMVLDHLTAGQPLYIEPDESLYTLKVADMAQRSAQTHEVLQISGVDAD
jgi:biliverdin reductase